jgi:hypothetical protein
VSSETAGANSQFVRVAELTSAFYRWEERGRGWQVSPHPVDLEPPFRPFTRHDERQPVFDDARKPTLLGGWLERLFGKQTQLHEAAVADPEEPEPPRAAPFSMTEIQVALAPDVKVTGDSAEHFLLSLSTCRQPISFELVGTSEAITLQFATSETDAPQVRDQLRAYFPDAVLSEAPGFLAKLWDPSAESVVIDFGLSQEFMRPIRTFARFDTDPLIGIIGALSDLEPGDVAVFQVLLHATRAPWSESIMRSATDWDGEAFFIDAPEFAGLANTKVSRPLYAAVIRVAVQSEQSGRAWQLARRIGATFAPFADPTSNELIALSNADYPDDAHARDVVKRQSRRSGAILNSEELVSFVHPPSTSVRSPRLKRDDRRTKAAPKALPSIGMVIGENIYGGTSRPIALTEEQRLRHTHVVGASGTGKSTLLMRMLTQDIEQGHGFAVLDPHGDLIDELLCRIPETRQNDVILVDPADVERPIGFNILSAHSELEKTLLASDLVAVFRRLSTSWGDQMTSVLSNAVLAFLESTRGGTLADLRRFLVEAEYRKEFLPTVTDREVVYYWQKEFPLLSGRPQAPLLTRLDTFLRPRLVRGMVTQATSLDFTAIMNGGQILLVKLAQGAIGEENAALLGSLFIAKLHQLALGRQAVAEHERRPFYLYCDEFQHFVTPSMATLLTGARKYRLGLVLAHQELRQLWNQDRDVAGAVLANAATRICFRVGDDDAKKLEDGFSSFTARDLQNLGRGQAMCRVDRADYDFSLTTSLLPALTHTERERHASIVGLSRERHGGTPIAEPSTTQEPPPVIVRERPPVTPTAVRALDGPATVSESSVTAGTRPSSHSSTGLPGRGGAQHKYLQELIRQWAGVNGWKATVEQRILDGLGCVDVALERGDTRVACEISVSSTTDHEIRNIRKCLAAGFTQVMSVVVDRRALETLRKAIAQGLEPTDKERVRALEPQELFAVLGQLVSDQSPTDNTTRGYKVKVTRGATGSKNSPGRTVAQTVVGALQRLRQNR